MSDLRILHFADLHLGVESGGRTDPATGLNQRVVDVCTRLDEVCEAVERDGVHLVLFAGDAFKHQHPSPTLQSLFASRIRRMARAGASVFLLVGNHDLPKMAGLQHPFSIYEALEVEGVVIGERAAVYRVPLQSDAPAREIQVAALPHFSKQQVLARMVESDRDPDKQIDDALAQTVQQLGSDVDAGLPSVFTGHCHVNQAELGGTQDFFGVSDVEVLLSTLVSGKLFPYYALGHVHKRQVLSREPFVAYSGSLERVDFGEGSRVDVSSAGRVETKEAEPKGFYRVDLVRVGDTWTLSGEPEFRPVSSRAFVTIRTPDLDHADPMGDLTTRIERASTEADITGAFVRVMATLDASDRPRVTANAVRDLLRDAYDVRLSLDSPERAGVRDPRFAKRMSEVEALESYVDSREDWGEDRKEILELGRALIAEVIER